VNLDRRDFLMAGAATAVMAGLPRPVSAAAFAPTPGAWRSFEIVTRIEISGARGATQAWAPLPSFSDPDWFKPMGSLWQTNARAATAWRDPKYGAELLHVSWSDGEAAPFAEITSRFATRDRAIDLAKPGKATALSAAERKLYTSPTALIPTDGIVKAASDKAIAGAKSELDKARALYEWVVENTERNPKTRGCGAGDIAGMLKRNDLTGKCADLNALYVGMARAAGLPARDVYGLRVAPSAFGYKSLGAGTEVVTKAQHCRAEVYLTGFGWVPVDPADVRKVVLEEPPGTLTLKDEKVAAARETLFGAWEMNWLAYNVAHDIPLPGDKGRALDFLMYPQAETAGERLDSLDPDTFKYTIVRHQMI
jgi:transglutaminase-like putative cysteine protease